MLLLPVSRLGLVAFNNLTNQYCGLGTFVPRARSGCQLGGHLGSGCDPGHDHRLSL